MLFFIRLTFTALVLTRDHIQPRNRRIYTSVGKSDCQLETGEQEIST